MAEMFFRMLFRSAAEAVRLPHARFGRRGDGEAIRGEGQEEQTPTGDRSRKLFSVGTGKTEEVNGGIGRGAILWWTSKDAKSLLAGSR